MKFSKSVVVVAWALMATSAFAQDGVQSNASAAATVQPAPVVQEVKVQTVQVETKQAETKADAKADVKAADSQESTKADAIKKVRQEAEQKNDSKIVEKLEKTRLDEEKQLADKIDTTNLKQDAAKEQAPQTVQVQIIQPKQEQSVVNLPKDDKKDAQKDEAAKDEKKEDPNADKWYVGAGIGGLQYTSGNVTTKSSYGFQVGTIIEDRLILEGSLGITALNMNSYTYYPLYQNVNQYDLAIAAKYILSNSGRFHPYVGADGDYIMRTYTNRNDYDQYSMYSQDTSQTTNAFDVGLLVGVDFSLTKQFLIGAEAKYNFNVYAQQDNAASNGYFYNGVRPLEETSFTSFLISAKFLF
jgi:outer membrane protein W